MVHATFKIHRHVLSLSHTGSFLVWRNCFVFVFFTEQKNLISKFFFLFHLVDLFNQDVLRLTKKKFRCEIDRQKIYFSVAEIMILIVSDVRIYNVRMWIIQNHSPCLRDSDYNIPQRHILMCGVCRVVVFFSVLFDSSIVWCCWCSQAVRHKTQFTKRQEAKKNEFFSNHRIKFYF